MTRHTTGPAGDRAVAGRPTAGAAWMAVATVTSAVLLLGDLGEKGFWLDEALSVQRAGLGWPALWRELTTSQANMGLYYVLLHPWLTFGTSEAAVRSLSVLLAVLAVPAVFVTARRLAGDRAALVATLLLALNAFFIRYGQEARGYSLVVLLVTLATLAFARALDRPSPGRLATYAVAAALSAYAHLFSTLVIVAHAVALGVLVVIRSPRAARACRGLIAAWTGTAALTSPLVAFVLFRDVGQIDWVPAPRAVDVARFAEALAGGGWLLLGLYAAAAGIAFARALPARRDAAGAGRPTLDAAGADDSCDGIVVLAAWLLAPVILTLLVSTVKPVFQPRYLIVSLPAFVMLAGAGVARLRVRPLALAWLTSMLVLSALGVQAWKVAPERQFWRRAATFVMSRAEPGDAVTFFVYSARVPFEYYVAHLRLATPDAPLVDLAAGGWIAGNRQPEPSPAVLESLTASRDRVWLVRLQDGMPAGHPLRRHEQAAAIETALGRLFDRVVRADFPGGIRVERWDRRTRAGTATTPRPY